MHSTGLTGSISDCKGSRAKVKFDGDPGDILVGALAYANITVVDVQTSCVHYCRLFRNRTTMMNHSQRMIEW